MQSKPTPTQLASEYTATLASLANTGRLSSGNYELSRAILPFVLATIALPGQENSPPQQLPPLLSQSDISGSLENLRASINAIPQSIATEPLIQTGWSVFDTLATHHDSPDIVGDLSRDNSPAHHSELPPVYIDQRDHFGIHQHHHVYDLPAYEGQIDSSSDLSVNDTKVRHVQSAPDLGRYAASTSQPPDEKMRLELEGMTVAIERLYAVAPQLGNQRVELKAAKRQELELAKMGDRLETQKPSRFQFLRSRSSNLALSERFVTPVENAKDKGKGKSKEPEEVNKKEDIEELLDILDFASRMQFDDQQYHAPDEAQRLKRVAAREAAKVSVPRAALRCDIMFLICPHS